jgi:hypothetical protein
LDLGGAASREEAFEAGVPETYDHLSTSFRGDETGGVITVALREFSP